MIFSTAFLNAEAQSTVKTYDDDFGVFQISPDVIEIDPYGVVDVIIKGTLLDIYEKKRNISIEVYEPDGSSYYQTFLVTKSGAFQGVIQIDKDSLVGRYQITATYNNTSSSQISFEVLEPITKERNVVFIKYDSFNEGCEIFNDCLKPTTISIYDNSEVTWENLDTSVHTITSGSPINGDDGDFESGLIAPGRTFSHQFTEKGSYQYYCSIHPWKVGLVIVEEDISDRNDQNQQPLEITKADIDKNPEEYQVLIPKGEEPIFTPAETPKGYPVMSLDIPQGNYSNYDHVPLIVQFTKDVYKDVTLKITNPEGDTSKQKLKFSKNNKMIHMYTISENPIPGTYDVKASATFGGEFQSVEKEFVVIEPVNQDVVENNSTDDNEPRNNDDDGVDDDGGGGCLIATAAYGSEMAYQVQKLREVRNSLESTESGMAFMNNFNSAYYTFSPTVADWERQNPFFKEMVKISITPMLSILSIMEHANSDFEIVTYGVLSLTMIVGFYVIGPAYSVIKIKKIIK